MPRKTHQYPIDPERARGFRFNEAAARCRGKQGPAGAGLDVDLVLQ